MTYAKCCYGLVTVTKCAELSRTEREKKQKNIRNFIRRYYCSISFNSDRWDTGQACWFPTFPMGLGTGLKIRTVSLMSGKMVIRSTSFSFCELGLDTGGFFPRRQNDGKVSSKSYCLAVITTKKHAFTGPISLAGNGTVT